MHHADGDEIGTRAPLAEQKRWQDAHFAVAIGWLLLGGSVAGLWEYLASAHVVNPLFFGQPSNILRSFLEGMRGDLLLVDAPATIYAAVVGVATASAAGIACAFAVSQSRLARRIISPYMTALNSLPRVALAPIFLLWFGLGIVSKVALAASLTFFVVFNMTMAGIDSVDRDQRLLARLLGASGRQVFTKFVIPSAVPGIFAGLELGLIYGMLGTVTSEMFAGQHGLGARLSYEAGTFNTSGYFATLLLLILITTAISQILQLVRGRLLRWQGKALS